MIVGSAATVALRSGRCAKLSPSWSRMMAPGCARATVAAASCRAEWGSQSRGASSQVTVTSESSSRTRISQGDRIPWGGRKKCAYTPVAA